jgi:endonuclease YncB( thermonuclease family)
MTYTLSQSNGQFNSLKYNTLFQNPHQYKVPELSKDTKTRLYEAYEGSRAPKFNAPVNGSRSMLDRVLDGLQVFNYTIAGGINAMIDKDDSTNFGTGVWEGLKASNPFGKGYEQGEVTFSKVLDTAGWQPESGFGKFLRGTAGFVLDVALDPTTYLGGVGALVKGTGVVGSTAKALDEVAKTLPSHLLNEKGKLTKMTDEVATYILKNNPEKAEALAKLSDDDFTGLVSDFTRNYNRSLGIREASEITFGLKNAPFGEWAVRKLGMKRGEVTLSKSNKGLMQIGKYSGLSHVYGATRNFLMGTKMIQKLSKTARYSQFAKTNPMELFDAIGYLKTAKGQQQSIRRAKQEAIINSEALSKFSPAVQKLIIQLQEDPANWKIVEGMYDEAELKTLSEFREAYGKELEELLDKRGLYEDTYESILAHDEIRVKEYSAQIEKELKRAGEIRRQTDEINYNIDWLRAEREQKVAELNKTKITSELDIELRRIQIDELNKEYEEAIENWVAQKSSIEQSVREMAEYLGKERSLEVSANGFDLVKATPEMMEEEMMALARQHEDAMNKIDDMVRTRQISFDEAQQARDDLALQLEAEAKRIYGRQYYQVKKSTNLGRELKEQEETLANTLNAIEKLKEMGAEGYSDVQVAKINETIRALEEQRDGIRKQINELSSAKRIKEKIKQLEHEEVVLYDMSFKSFGTSPTRFDEMSFEDIQSEFQTTLREFLIEDADNETMMKLASNLALMSDEQAEALAKSLGLEENKGVDFRSIIGNAYDSREMLFANQLRDMLSELLLGKPGKLFPPKDITINMARFILTDPHNDEALMKYFTSEKNFYNRKLSADQAGRVIEKLKVVGHIPVMREALADNYAMFSGMSARFWKRMGHVLGYKKWSDVRDKMDALEKVIERQQKVIDDAMQIAESPTTLNLTPQGVIEEIAQKMSLSKEDILTRMGMVKPLPQYKSMTDEVGKAQAVYEAEVISGIPEQEAKAKLDHVLAILEEKHNLYLKEKQALDNFPINHYNLDDEFLDSLEESLYRMHPELEKAYNELYQLKGKERVRAREQQYFFSLDEVAQEQYLRYAEQDKRFGEFVQGMFNKEIERVRQVAMEESSALKGSISSKELEADLGTKVTYSYDEIVENIPEGAVKNLYYNFMFSNVVRNMPTSLKNQIDEIKATQRLLTLGLDSVSNGGTALGRNVYLDITKEGTGRFIREVLRGNITKFNREGVEEFIEKWLIKAGEGMDKRTKAYRELKGKAQKMREQAELRANLVEAVNEGVPVLHKLDADTTVKLLKTFGMERLQRISKTNNVIWEIAKRPKENGGGFPAMFKAVDELFTSKKQALDEMLQELNEAKKSNNTKIITHIENALSRVMDEYEEAIVLKNLFDFNMQKKGNKLHPLLGRAITDIAKELAETKGVAKELRNNYASTVIGTQAKPNKAVIQKARDVEMVLPYIVGKFHPGKHFDELTDVEKNNLIRKTLGVLEKDLGGVAPRTVQELEQKLATKLTNLTKERELTRSYERFLTKADDGLHIVFVDENGKQMTGRLIESDNLPEAYGKDIKLKIQAITQSADGTITAKNFDVPYENVLRTKTSPVADIFNTVDTAIERQLRETQAQLKQSIDELENGKHIEQAEELKGQVDTLSQEIDALYKRRTETINSYYGKVGELEALQQTIETRIADLNSGINESLVKQLELQAERQEKLADAQLVRFESEDPFATAVPSTKEWEDLRAFVIANDEEIQELLAQITEDAPKKLHRQFEKLVEQRMLGFAKGDGFKLFQYKMELINEQSRISDEVGVKMQELSKFQEDLAQREALKEADVDIVNDYMDKVEVLQNEIDVFNKTIADMDEQIAKFDESIQQSIDGLGTELEILKRQRISKSNEMNALYKQNKADELTSVQNLEVLEREMHKLNDEIAKLEDALSSDEAFETLLSIRLGKDKLDAIKRKTNGLNTWKYAIEDADLDENVKQWAVWLHEEMRRAGIGEVNAGKLSKGAFEEMINSYFPRVLSEEGERFFAENQELLEKVRPLTSDYGFGTKFNNHGLQRHEELRHKSLFEVNNYFESEYGVRIFEEDLARAYVGRMVKHAELMYDDHYTKTMMDLFGYEIGADLKVKEGYEAVANMGHVRQYIRELVDLQVKMEEKRTGEAVSDVLKAKFQEQAVTQLRLTPEQLDQYKFPMVRLSGESLSAFQKAGLARQMNSHIVEEANMARQMTIDRDNSRMLELFDKFSTWIKAMQTAVMPSFHFRNWMSNMFQNWLAVGAEAFSPRMAKDSWKASMAMGNREKLRALKPINPINPNAPILHWEKIYDEAIIHGVIDEGFFAKDFDGHATSSGLLGGGKFDPTSTENFAPIKAGFHVGSVVENQGRLAQFATHLKHGKSFEEASELVRKYLFDYSDLTLFEKRYLKRIFPYYTWMRKNSVLQVRELIEQPQKYSLIGKFMQSMENSADPNNEIEDKYISDYARDWMVTPFTMTKKDTNAQGEEYETQEPILFSPNLPFMDIARLPDPFNLFNSMQNFFTQTTPIVKTPLESLMNYNTHFDSPIVKEGSNPLTANLNHALSTLAWYNAIKSMATADTSTDLALAVTNSTVGLKMSSYDYDANKRATIQQAWEEYYEKGVLYYLKNGQTLITDAMNWELQSSLSKSIVKLAGLPKSAGEYNGALAPISAETYESLSDEEKAKYVKPTTGEVGYYHQRAIELSQQAYDEAGVFKKFAWTLLDVVDVPYKNQIQTVRVNSVTDGDTLGVSIDGVDTQVRLLLVDTPESKGEYKDNPMAFGVEAYEYTKQLALGKDAKIYFDGYDAYGRMVGFVEVGDTSVNEELIREGLAKVRYLFERDDRNADVQHFRNIEQEAVNQNKGVWSIPGYAKQGDTDYRGGRSSQ